MKYFRSFFTTVFLFIPLHVFAIPITEHTLGNGLKILIIEEHKAPAATFQVWYRVGLKEEPAGKSGLSHFLEHMMFKGTPQHSPKMFSKAVQENGGEDNAYTTEDYTVFYQTFPSDKLSFSCLLESDRMQHLLLDQKEISVEREVVKEERRLENVDNPQNSLLEEVVAMSFKVHPYQRPVIGWMSDLESIGRDDLLGHYKEFYTPGNAFIVIAGDVKAGDAIESIKNYFGNIPKGPGKREPTSSEPGQPGERRIYMKREAVLPYMLAAYHVPCFPHEDSYALDVLDALLSAGRSSRLYSTLVYDKKIALDAGSDYSGFRKNPHLFFIDATASPGMDIKKVEESLYAEIEKIGEEQPSAHELQKAKNRIASSFIMEQDSLETMAELYGVFEMIGDWRLTHTYLDGIRRVTAGDVSRVAKRYLKEDNRTVGILLPVRGEEE